MKEKTNLIALVCDLSNINMEKPIILRICISSFIHCYGKQKIIAEKISISVLKPYTITSEYEASLTSAVQELTIARVL